MPHVKFIIAATIAFAVAALPGAPAWSQEQPVPSAGSLKVALDRLGTTARVLYVAAHPDDENTRLLAYLANHRHLDVAYLSITRGGGGQNLIGSEQAELLAAIRTQELLAARRTDGARQFFTRARDFGYSKTSKETLSKWGYDAILSDVVWVIRKFRPDVIITRFNETGINHGHHTASAILARAAFTAASDPSKFPEQLKLGVTPWAPHRLAVNVPRWGRSKDDVSAYLPLDVGGYDPRLGASYGEIAARSRTNHKSQGFGSSGRRGPIMEYFDTLEGPKATQDILDGVVLDWDRFEGGDRVTAALIAAKAAFSVDQPERMVPALLRVRQALSVVAKRRPLPRVLERIEDTDALIADALGLYVQLQAERPEATAGASVKVKLELVLRRPATMTLNAIEWPSGRVKDGRTIEEHVPVKAEKSVAIKASTPPSVAHWLRRPLQADTYPVTDPRQVAEPEDPASLWVGFDLTLAGKPWSWRAPITYRWTDLVHGERRRPLIVVPALTISPLAKVTLFPAGKTQTVSVVARAGRENVQGTVQLDLPKAWKAEPSTHAVKLAAAGEETTLRFRVTPPSADADPVVAGAVAKVGTTESRLRFDVIDYPHLPVQGILRHAQVRLVPLAFTPPRARVGYIRGSGDTVAEDLLAVGVNVETIDAATLRSGRFDNFDAIILGVRAYNTREDELSAAHPALMKWVQAGGRLVVQYNTSNRWKKLTAPVGPFPFEIDRERVTDERAKMTVLDPKHAIFRRPHKIGAQDFDNWVQERGLYFAKTWDDRYKPLLAAHDPGEKELKGSLIYADYGKGAFVYTGLSFFRQLPAGVPGAYRLLANILSAGEDRS